MRYHTRTAQRVQLTVYDLLGRPVCNLFEGNSPSGVHELTWDGRDGAGRPVAAGVYWIYMTTATNRLSQKIVLLK
jgi:flagellar hook assembly protein FlgD